MKDKSWEERFDKKFALCEGDVCPRWLSYSGICRHDDGFFCEHRRKLIKSFLKKELTLARKGQRKEINKLFVVYDTNAHDFSPDTELIQKDQVLASLNKEE